MKNQILITIDSLRFDVFEAANIPWLKSFGYDKGYTVGVFTLPAHTSMFAGKLPCTFSGQFNFSARVLRELEGRQPWNLIVPGNKKQKFKGYNEKNKSYFLKGRNIVDGFNNMGWNTVGCGAVDWFNNTESGSYITAVDDFKSYKYTGYTLGLRSSKYAIKHFNPDMNNFIFINYGETHAPFRTSKKQDRVEYGDFDECFKAQVKCLEQVEKYIKHLHDSLSDFEMYVMADHGECLGEDGLWGHTFYHEKVMEVPILKIVK